MDLWSTETPFINQSASPYCLLQICQVLCLAVQEGQRKAFIEELLLTLGQLQPLPRDLPWQHCTWPRSRREHLSHYVGAACLRACLPNKTGALPQGRARVLLPSAPPRPSCCLALSRTLVHTQLSTGGKYRQDLNPLEVLEALTTWLPTQ